MEARNRIAKPGKGTITLRTLPDDVKKILLEEQGIYKAECNCQFSLPQTIFKIVRKWKRIKGYRVNGVTINKMSEELSLSDGQL